MENHSWHIGSVGRIYCLIKIKTNNSKSSRRTILISKICARAYVLWQFIFCTSAILSSSSFAFKSGAGQSLYGLILITRVTRDEQSRIIASVLPFWGFTDMSRYFLRKLLFAGRFCVNPRPTALQLVFRVYPRVSTFS